MYEFTIIFLTSTLFLDICIVSTFSILHSVKMNILHKSLHKCVSISESKFSKTRLIISKGICNLNSHRYPFTRIHVEILRSKVVKSVMFVWILSFGVTLKKKSPIQDCKNILPCFLIGFWGLLFVFVSVIHREFILIYTLTKGSNFVFFPNG